MAFNLDYNRFECYALDTGSSEAPLNLRQSSGVAYFEAICLRSECWRVIKGGNEGLEDCRDFSLMCTVTLGLLATSEDLNIVLRRCLIS